MKKNFGNHDFQDLKVKLNTIKLKSGMLSALCAHPGIISDNDQFDAHNEHINQLYNETSQKVIGSLLPENAHPGQKAALKSSVANLVSELWRQHKDPTKLDSEFVSKTFLASFETAEPTPDMAFSSRLPSNVQHSLAEGRAVSKMTPQFLRISNFGSSAQLFINDLKASEAMNVVKNDFINRSTNLADNISKSDRDTNEWSIVYRSVLNSLSDIYKEVISNEIQRLGTMLKKLDKAGRDEYKRDMKNHPHGVLITNVIDSVSSIDEMVYNQHEEIKNQKDQHENAPEMQ